MIRAFSIEQLASVGNWRIEPEMAPAAIVEAPSARGPRHQAKLDAADKQGIRTALACGFAPDQTADVVVEATGSPSGLELAMKAVRPRGTIDTL